MGPGVFFAFFVGWIALGAGFAILLYGPFDIRLKRTAWRVGTIMSAILFAAFVNWQGWPRPPWIVLAVLPLIVWFNWNGGRFCNACGAFQQRVFTAPWQSIRPSEHCIRCGKKVDEPRPASIVE